MRRAFYQFYVSTKSPIASDLLARVASLYAIEAEIRGHPADDRRQVRQDRSRPIVEALQAWLQVQLPRVPGGSDLAKATLRHHMEETNLPKPIPPTHPQRAEFNSHFVEGALRAACNELIGPPAPASEAAQRAQDDTIALFVQQLALIASLALGHSGTAPNEFLDIGRQACQRELKAVRKLALRLAEAIDGLHEPSILALANVGITFPRPMLSADVRRLVTAIDAIPLDKLLEKAGRGRKTNNLSAGVTMLTAAAFTALTSKPPSLKWTSDNSKLVGPWADFLEKVFKAMGFPSPGSQFIRMGIPPKKRRDGNSPKSADLKA